MLASGTDASNAAGKAAEPSRKAPIATLKVKVPTVGPGGAKLKSKLKTKSPVTGEKPGSPQPAGKGPASSGKALKLKAMPRTQAQPAGKVPAAKSGKALKLKAMPRTQTQPGQAQPAGKVPARSGKTLKLMAIPRAQTQSGQAQPAVAADPAKKPLKLGAAKKRKQIDDAGTEPDIIYVLSAVASLIAVGITAAMLMSQYYSLF